MSGDDFNDAQKRVLRALADGILNGIGRGGGGASAGSSTGGVEDGPVADDADLEGQYGDFEIKRPLAPRYWNGEPFAGKRLSELDEPQLVAVIKWLLACEYMARKEGDAKKADYKVRDAARARGWLRRVRANGGKPVASAAQTTQAYAGGGQWAVDDPYASRGAPADDAGMGDDEIPF